MPVKMTIEREKERERMCVDYHFGAVQLFRAHAGTNINQPFNL